jgi:hypothetical protein
MLTNGGPAKRGISTHAVRPPQDILGLKLYWAPPAMAHFGDGTIQTPKSLKHCLTASREHDTIALGRLGYAAS